MNLETLKISFALDIKLFEESVSRDIGTEGGGDALITTCLLIKLSVLSTFKRVFAL
jgi:hypothetical protein